MTADPALLLQQAEEALGSGQLDSAAQLLSQAAGLASDDPAVWLRLAAVHRANGKPAEALKAVRRALEAAPLDFMALLMQASLLDRLGDASAGEAWDHALAQTPDGDLPPQVEAAVAQGRQRRDAWLDAREAAFVAAMAESEASADARRAQADCSVSNQCPAPNQGLSQ